ncbi:hypothetical protein PS627_02392 [Pseudomonas fluorescens]|nr:hypothetical protein PS627_02392 [Pseudomonas fluorescens]VVP93415.1 hypothetical protein PS910_03103 [Pseudomonas fluorescens]
MVMPVSYYRFHFVAGNVCYIHHYPEQLDGLMSGDIKDMSQR